ncbi:MAG: energy-coupling factor transporter ATPase [Clostridia bacterium]
MPIKIKNVSYIYSPGTPFEIKALDNINLEIEDHSFTAIIGQTGSGKSTLIQHFNGLIIPTEGTVVINNITTEDKKDRKKIRTKVGIVFQYPEHQLFEETVFSDIAYGPKNMGFDEAEVKRRVEEALLSVGLELDLLEKSPFDLSGGQMRRVAMAGVLAMKPKILILDEPTAGLDPKTRRNVLTLIKDLRENHNITIIIVTHDMSEVAHFADRVIVLHQGKVVLDGAPREVFLKIEDLKAIGLDAPPLTLLFDELRKRGWNVSPAVISEDEALAEICKELGVEKC